MFGLSKTVLLLLYICGILSATSTPIHGNTVHVPQNVIQARKYKPRHSIRSLAELADESSIDAELPSDLEFNLDSKKKWASQANIQAQMVGRREYSLFAKMAALIFLVMQNSGLTVTMRLSRTSKASHAMYVSSTAVVMTELTKLVIACLAFVIENGGKSTFNEAFLDIFGDLRDLAHVAIPSALYVVQNNLQFVATSNLPAEVYQVLIQMKLITTALFARTMMGKILSVPQWTCIFTLFGGIALVQLSLQTAVATGTASSLEHLNPVVGISAVLLTCLTSGYAGVYYERTLKTKKQSIWVRNIQMCVISIVLATAAVCKDLPQIASGGGVFQGYNALVLKVIALQALGGILTSVVVKMTSSVAKGFATSASILVSCLLSALLIKDAHKMTPLFFCGATVVCMATIAYSWLTMCGGRTGGRGTVCGKNGANSRTIARGMR